MNSLRSLKPKPRIAVLRPPTTAVRWDLALMVMLMLLGLMAHPVPHR